MNNNESAKNTSILVETWGTPLQRIVHDIITEANSPFDDYEDNQYFRQENEIPEIANKKSTLFGAAILCSVIRAKLVDLKHGKNPINDMYRDVLDRLLNNLNNLDKMLTGIDRWTDSELDMVMDPKSYYYSLRKKSIKDNQQMFELQLRILAKDEPVEGVDAEAISNFYYEQIKPDMDKVIRRLKYRYHLPVGFANAFPTNVKNAMEVPDVFKHYRM